jgi:hypothetical protein
MNLISRQLGDRWDFNSRVLGLPNEKFFRAFQRAGVCIYPFRIPSRI